MPSLFWMLLAAARSGPRPYRIIMHLLAELRAVCRAEAAEGMEGYGQSVSTLQAVGYGYAADTGILAHGSAEAVGQALAVAEAPLSVVLGLSGDSTGGFALAQAAEAAEGYGQSVTELLGVALADSMGLVYGYGQTACTSKGYLLGGTAEAQEAAGRGRGYLTGSLHPGSDAGYALVLAGVGEGIGSLTPDTQDVETVLMVTELHLEASCFAEALGSFTVTFVVDGEIAHQETVLEGDSCPDPVAAGIIVKPTKQSTISHTYEYSGWTTVENSAVESDALTSITQDIVVSPAFTESIRYYDISFYDEGVLLATIPFAYGETPTYTAVKDGMIASGWIPELAPVSGEAGYIAQWRDPLALGDATWSEIAAVAESGHASDFYNIGDVKEFVAGGVTYEAQIAAFDYDALTADTTKKAGISFVVKGVYPTRIRFGSRVSGICWPTSVARTYCINTIYPTLPDALRSVIKTVQKTSSYYSAGKIISDDAIWLPSASELNHQYYGDTYENMAAYPLFTDDASRANEYVWVTRSCRNTNVAGVSKVGAGATYYPDSYFYLRFGFCI